MQTQNVVTDKEREIRKRDLEDKDRKNASERRQEQKNQNFTQVYPLGWKRLRELFRKNPGAAELYSMLAENIDGSCGAVVADQTHLASLLGVGRQTISRYVKWLEEQGVLVKIPVAGKVCAYALNPHEVWKGYDNAKPYAAFLTKTLVNKDGDIQRRIMAMFHGNDARQGMEG
ncbi:helix-turn-helix domain-containing protein, partial [Shigella flexneri]|nr:helix-turn-helix domain-containing protein [Shigella flexneri]